MDFATFEKAFENRFQRYDFFLSMSLKKEISIEASKWDINGVLNNARMMCEKNLDRFYPKINVEVLLINGTKDQAYQKMEGQELKGSIEKSVALWIKEANHFPQVENPEKTTELIRKNLEINPLNSLGNMIE